MIQYLPKGGNMTPERSLPPAPQRPCEAFGFTEHEQLFWRVNQARFAEILKDDKTLIHKAEDSSNDFGEFLFVTASRSTKQGRIYMTFYGLGYHEYRERWLTNEWFWYQSNPDPNLIKTRLDKKEVEEMIQKHRDEVLSQASQSRQSMRGKLFEILADLTDEDGAKAEMEDVESLHMWLIELDQESLPEQQPNAGENLLDPASREKLPHLRSGEELSSDALAQVKFFTPDSDWTWYASEFDGKDIFFGLVSGFDVEYGYFSLKELQEARGPLGLQIERDVDFEPKTLKELEEWHIKQREKPSDSEEPDKN
jgi:hypothetical protein